MRTSPIRRKSLIRPIYRGHRGKHHPTPVKRLRASDLPLIAAAFGITVTDLIDTARRTQ